MSRSLLVARNVASTLMTQVLSWLLQLSVILFLPKYAGVKGLGLITLAASFTSIFALFSSLGTSTVLMRDIPRSTSNAGRLVVASLIARLPLAVVSIALAWLVALKFSYGRQLILFINIGMVGVVLGVISDTLSSAARGLQNFLITNIGGLIDKLVMSALVILVCIEHWPLWLIVASPLLSSGLSIVYMLFRLGKVNLSWPLPTVGEVKDLVIAGLPFVSAGVFVAIYAKSDAIFLSKLSTLQAIGWYGLAFRISGTAMALPVAICSAMMPALSVLYVESQEAFAEGTSRLINLMVICCIPIAATMVLCPLPLIQLFSHHTASFAPAVNVVRVYGIAVMLWFISQAVFTSIIACDQQKVAAASMGVGALISIPLTAGCIYVGQHVLNNGAVGAALSDMLIEVFLLASYIGALPRGSFSISILTVTIRGLAASLPLVMVLYFLPTWLALLLAIPCVVLYGFLCMKFKCLSQKDVELFGRLAGNKLGIGQQAAS